MKLALLAPLWGRFNVFELFKTGLERLQNVHPFDVVIVGSEGQESKEACKDFHYVEAPNKPLGDKMNQGLQKIKELNPDYVLLTGTDHILDDSLLEKHLSYIDQGIEDIAIRDGYFYDSDEKELWYSEYTDGRTQGMARCLSRRVIEELDFELWHPDQTIRMDKSIEYRLSTVDHKAIVYSIGKDHFCMDIKNGKVLNPIDSLPNREPREIETLTKFLPQEEVKAILSL